ncbi:MAG: FHA domain-containing protein [Anaerolineae bacterium]|nr:FHA domain-containing protein [Anaerolineae bacterium]
MEPILLALRVLMALLLLGLLGAILYLLLREPTANAIPTTKPHLPAPAKLIALAPEQDNPRTFELTRITWIGRDPNSLVYVDDARVSARHAQLVWDAEVGAWFVEDNASRNGTLVNGVRVARQVLTDGDVIEIGGMKFQFALLGARR